jgi:hypothetical protein
MGEKVGAALCQKGAARAAHACHTRVLHGHASSYAAAIIVCSSSRVLHGLHTQLCCN